MASIQSKGKKTYIVYDDLSVKKGEKRKQIWEEVQEGKDPEIALAEFNVKRLKGKVISHSSETLAEFVQKWIEVYAPENWGYKTYSTNIGLVNNHIIDEIGHMKMKSVDSFTIETLIQRLRKKKVKGCKSYNKEEKDVPVLSSTTVGKVYILLNKIFAKAVEWKCIEENPVICNKPEPAKEKRKTWSKKYVQLALQDMEDEPLLHLMVHNAFICSLRNGENMGITLDCIDLERNCITINKTIQRVERKALEAISKDELIYVFPVKNPESKSVLVLKNPKTESSVRVVYMTEPLREEIIKRIGEIENNKELLGGEYARYEYEMLFCQYDGSPIEPGLSEKMFKKQQMKSKLNLPVIDFHGIRHSSVTYKVKISGGDFATVKGDSGHATMQMVGHYADHTFDEDRVELNKQIEAAFYEENQDNKDERVTLNTLLRGIEQIANNNVEYRQKVLETLVALVGA